MSIPLLLKLTEEYPFEDAFSYVVYPEQMQHPILRRHQSLGTRSRPMCMRRLARQPHHMQNKYEKATDLSTNIEKNGFQILLNTKDFAPNEISVKTIDNTVVVEGRHEKKEDEHGHIFRHFIRKYTLPKEVDVNDVISTLSPDGELTIRAPLKPKSVETTERVIQIQEATPHQINSKEAEKVIGGEEMVAV